MSNNRELIVFPLSAVFILACVFILLEALSAGDRLIQTTADRKVVESSRQYAESNRQAFEDRKRSVYQIKVQLASLPPGDPQIPALQSQEQLLESEMQEEVQKIPADMRAPDMIPYLNGVEN